MGSVGSIESIESKRKIMSQLTTRQQEVLEKIRTFIIQKGVPPTVRELGKLLGIGPSGVHEHLQAIKRKGYLRQDSRRSRSLEITGWKRPGEDAVNIPLIGRVAAGRPFMAEENFEGIVALDKSFVRGKNTFLLRVQGDSMIEAGILEGDMALVRIQHRAENGEIAVVQVDGEATLKRFFRKGRRIILQGANRAFEPMVFSADSKEIRIIGKVVGIIRKY